MIHRGFTVILIAIGAIAWLVLPGAARAQSVAVFDSVRSPNGWCHVWFMPPGLSNFPEDAAYRRCALTQPPRLRSAPELPAPRTGRYAGGSFLVVVDSSGRVDRHRTRAYTTGGDSSFHKEALDAIRRWRFDPGTRGGRPVRSAFELELRSDDRVDTLPSTLSWRLASGTDSDTLIGNWIAGAPLPLYDGVTRDSIQAAVTRRLVRMQVLSAGSGASHFVLPRVYQTESGRAVVYPAGDTLPAWPLGLDARSWRAWKGRCIAIVPRGTGAVKDLTCDVSPNASPEEYAEQRGAKSQVAGLTGAPLEDGDSLRVMLIATTRGSYRTDTSFTTIRHVAGLGAHAVHDTGMPCGGWSAHASDRSAGHVVILGTLTGSLYATEASPMAARAPGAERGACERQGGDTSGFVAFTLGGVGKRMTAPITLCFSECRQSYKLLPGQHELASRPHVSVRLRDLRPDSRMSSMLIFRIVAASAPPNLVPIVVVRSSVRGQYSVFAARRVASDAWDYDVLYNDGYPPDTELYVYLVAR